MTTKHVSKVGTDADPKPGYSVTSFKMPLAGNYYAQGEANLEAAIALSKTLIGAAVPLFFCIAQAASFSSKASLPLTERTELCRVG